MMKKPTRIVTLAVLSILVLTYVFSSVEKKTHTVSPVVPERNVVLIVVDTLRADHLPFYGYPIKTAPFLTNLSRRSVVFRNTYSPSSSTTPAVASMCSSLYPFQHGVVTGLRATKLLMEKNQSFRLNRLPDEVETIADVFKARGYRTYAVTDNLNIREEIGFAQGFDKFKNFDYESAEVVNRQLKDWGGEIKSGGKYFLYIHYMDPHFPYNRNPPWYKRNLRRTLKARHIRRISKRRSAEEAKREVELREDVAAYDSEINYVDKHIRELFYLFGWGEDTLVVVTSDHGEEFLEHGGIYHGRTLYSEVINVPLLMYLPGGEPTLSVDDKVSLIDILPTLRDFIGLPTSENDEGLSLMPLIRNETRGERILFSHLDQKKMDLIINSVVYGEHKYIHTPQKSEELFNIKNDPKEKTSILRNSRGVAKNMKTKLDEFQRDSKKIKPEYETITLDEKTQQRLKDLGYTN